jgi:hypothetical protein
LSQVQIAVNANLGRSEALMQQRVESREYPWPALHYFIRNRLGFRRQYVSSLTQCSQTAPKPATHRLVERTLVKRAKGLRRIRRGQVLMKLRQSRRHAARPLDIDTADHRIRLRGVRIVPGLKSAIKESRKRIDC